MSVLAENLGGVRERIAVAARRSGRTPSDVTLVAVTKYVGVPEILELLSLGCRDLGESRPQTLWSKAAQIEEQRGLGRSATSGGSVPAPRWHLVGHLQRNKVERTLGIAELIHSADSLRLLSAIDAAAGGAKRVAKALLEVNISGDETKHGWKPEEVEPLWPQIAALSHVSIGGLMGMASREGDASVARGEFSRLRELRDRLSLSAPSNVSLAELSMGMSGDYEIAIEEGATIVRVGSAMFEGLPTREE